MQGLSLEEVMSFAKPEYSWESMNVIMNGIKKGLSQEKIDKILLGVEKGLSLEEVYLIMENDYNCEQIEELILGFLRGEAYEVKVFAKPCFNSSQMREIRLGFENGLDMKQILAYANPDLSAENMYKIRKKLKKRR